MLARLASALRGTRATVTMRPAWVAARSTPALRSFCTEPSLKPQPTRNVLVELCRAANRHDKAEVQALAGQLMDDTFVKKVLSNHRQLTVFEEGTAQVVITAGTSRVLPADAIIMKRITKEDFEAVHGRVRTNVWARAKSTIDTDPPGRWSDELHDFLNYLLKYDGRRPRPGIDV